MKPLSPPWPNHTTLQQVLLKRLDFAMRTEIDAGRLVSATDPKMFVEQSLYQMDRIIAGLRIAVLVEQHPAIQTETIILTIPDGWLETLRETIYDRLLASRFRFLRRLGDYLFAHHHVRYKNITKQIVVDASQVVLNTKIPSEVRGPIFYTLRRP